MKFLYRGRGKTLSDEEQNNALFRVGLTLSRPRRGQLVQFSDADEAFASCLVNSDHWIGFIMDRRNKVCTVVDSVRRADSFKKYANALVRLLDFADGPGWKFMGRSERFPMQQNSSDCGVLVLLAARNLLRREILPPELGNRKFTDDWRIRLSHEMLVQRAS